MLVPKPGLFLLHQPVSSRSRLHSFLETDQVNRGKVYLASEGVILVLPLKVCDLAVITFRWARPFWVVSFACEAGLTNSRFRHVVWLREESFCLTQRVGVSRK